jgi:transposase InsO family protein
VQVLIQTLQREWADAMTDQRSHQRSIALTPWIEYYNTRRPHRALGHRAPITRLPAA